jgi:hypothetical protein
MRRNLLVACGAASICALAIVATALATTGASHSSSRHAKAITRRTTRAGNGPGEGGPRGGGPGGAGGAVHSESVVLDKAGTAFITLTSDSGTVKSVEASAGKLTILEAAKSVTYKEVTLTIPSGATVTLDGKSSALEHLAAGDEVHVSSSSEGTTVFATDSSFHPEGAHGFGGPPPGGAPPSSE